MALYTIVAVLSVIVFYERAADSQVPLLTKLTAIAYAALFSAGLLEWPALRRSSEPRRECHGAPAAEPCP